jgi:opacity protein-like surface antigen
MGGAGEPAKLKYFVMKKFALISVIVMVSFAGRAQNIDSLLMEVAGGEDKYVMATFKSTHIVTGHSIVTMPKGQLDFRVAHRFGQLNTGAYNLWGLDEANIHLGFDFGFTDWLMVGVGRGTYEKTFDGLAKFAILRQTSGENNMPLSLTWLSTVAMQTIRWNKPGKEYLGHRLSYVHQLLIARKFNEYLSLELNPTMVHRNLVASELDPNDVFALGAGGRVKLTKRVTVNVEYYYVLPPLHDYRSQKTFDPLSVGFDIETGGHVFQVFLSNSVAMIEKGFITETTGNWLDGDIHFGFNISRVFNLYKNSSESTY